MLFIIFLIIAYLLGSLSSAIITCKLMGYADPRSEGSKNPGATNVLRIAGKQAAVIVLIGDTLKGLIPVLLAKLFHLPGMALGLVALAAIAGHMYPIFFQFQGGKGVATTLGALFGLSWILGGIVILIWISIAAISRYSSLASLCAVAIAPLLTIFINLTEYQLPLLLILVLVCWRHRENISRLLDGTESKIKL